MSHFIQNILGDFRCTLNENVIHKSVLCDCDVSQKFVYTEEALWEQNEALAEGDVALLGAGTA